MSKLKQWLDRFDEKYEHIVDIIYITTCALFIIYGVLYLTIWSK